ncbi:ABC transporter ATP-binding protein [Demequina flava]|uniref:ABC transporter ATP-binding protein n=1 Tax=Demequina flava TaxID=1095025 RepID=UPI000783C5C1|nr:ABC transporter ATP-binding protein [Demequina flava]
MTLPQHPDAIVVSDARKAYGDAERPVVALGGVDASIRRGDFVSIIGPSGCGKSTLLRMIAGLETADDGEVSIFGLSTEDACNAKMVGLVPQVPALLPWLTVRKNVTLPSRINPGAERRRRHGIGGAQVRTEPVDIDALLQRVGLADAAHKLPAELSGGMRQRASIVRAFGIQPEVLLMDEPFSALDEFTREALQGQLLEIWRDMQTTVVFVTHNVSEAVRLSDRVIIMGANPGRITAEVEINLPRPRDEQLLSSAEFHQYENHIRQHLQSAWRDNSQAAA